MKDIITSIDWTLEIEIDSTSIVREDSVLSL